MLAKKLMIALCAAATATMVFAQPRPEPPKPTRAAVDANGNIDGGEPKYLHPETPEQRKARVGTAEDPGNNPDPDKHFWRYGKSYHIEKYDRRWASYDDVEPGLVRAFAFVNAQSEVYQQNDKWVWVWIPDISKEELEAAATPQTPPTRYSKQQLEYFTKLRPEFFEVTPKASNTVVRFTEASDGLPTSGSWRNSLTVADMNGDGCPDLVTPPERTGNGIPAIFLGDCKGHWTYWSSMKWPRILDYGSVVAADFNHDGHMDLAFGVHLTGIAVFLGDGKGGFTESSKGLPTNFPTRRLLIADVDHDGAPDIVAVSEGPAGPRRRDETNFSRVRAYLNRSGGKEWAELPIAGEGVPTAGDFASIGNFNGDKVPDVVTGNIFYNSPNTIFVSTAPKKWATAGGTDGSIVPYLSYYFATTTGHFSSKKLDDAIVSYVRFWPGDLDATSIADPPAKQVVGIDRISFSGKTPVRTPIVRWPSNVGIWGMASGDFNGDGNLDLIYTRHDPREAVVLLGDGKGGFTRATIDGITVRPNTNYDLTVADVNGDGKPDVIVMYESSGATAFASRDGSIHVYLNRGASTVEPSKTADAKQ